MKKAFFTTLLLLYSFIFCTNIHALTCSIVDEFGNTITEAKAGDVVYLKVSYVNLTSGKMSWTLKVNLPTTDSKNYKTFINNSGYYYCMGTSQDDINFTPIAIPAFAYIKGTAIIFYTLSNAGKCSVPLYISEYGQPLPDTHTITATYGPNGSIAPSGAVSVSHGQSQTFKIIPNTGYHVAHVIVDGSSVGAVTSHTFNNVTSDHTINANFAINTAGKTWNVTADSYGEVMDISIALNPAKRTFDMKLTGVSGVPFTCYEWIFVQGPNRFNVSKSSYDEDTALLTPSGGWSACSAVNPGVTKSGVISHVPSWFDINAQFTFIFNYKNSFLLLP